MLTKSLLLNMYPGGQRNLRNSLLEEDLNIFIYDLPKKFHADVHEKVGCQMAQRDL